MKKWLPVIFFCIALSTAYALKAQASKAVAEQEVPAKIRGNWSLPDCGSTPEEALIITRHYYLRSDKDGSRFWILPPASKQKDYWVMPLEGQKHPVRLEADGVLKIGLMPPESTKKWAKNWDSLHMDGHREYMGCAEIPAVLPDPLVRVMKHIDDIAAACHASLSSGCTKLLFTIADENKNGKISVREMKTAATMLADLAALSGHTTVNRTMLDKATYQALREADRVSGGREMRYEDFKGFVAKANSAQLREALKNVGAIVPGFRN